MDKNVDNSVDNSRKVKMTDDTLQDRYERVCALEIAEYRDLCDISDALIALADEDTRPDERTYLVAQSYSLGIPEMRKEPA